jgi:hypothetical protein
VRLLFLVKPSTHLSSGDALWEGEYSTAFMKVPQLSGITILASDGTQLRGRFGDVEMEKR